MPCSCPFCRGTLPNGPGHYPYPVRVVHPAFQDGVAVACWAWLLGIASDNTATFAVRNERGRAYVVRYGVTSLIDYITSQHFPSRVHATTLSGMHGLVRARAPHVLPLDALPRGFSSQRPPNDAPRDAMCYLTMPEEVARPVRRPRVVGPPPPPQPPPPRSDSPSVLEERQRPSPACYALHDLGGESAQVTEIHAQCRGVWTADVAEAMVLVAGAQVPVHDVTRLVPGGRNRRVECVVVAPDGALVSKVVLPLVFVELVAPHLARQLT